MEALYYKSATNPNEKKEKTSKCSMNAKRYEEAVYTYEYFQGNVTLSWFAEVLQ